MSLRIMGQCSQTIPPKMRSIVFFLENETSAYPVIDECEYRDSITDYGNTYAYFNIHNAMLKQESEIIVSCCQQQK